MAKNKSNNNSHSTADNHTNKLTCPHCNLQVTKPYFKTVFFYDEYGNAFSIPDNKFFICEECDESFYYINGTLEPCMSKHIDIQFDDREENKRSKKIGRNEICPCGSGVKYKRCCGRN